MRSKPCFDNRSALNQLDASFAEASWMVYFISARLCSILDFFEMSSRCMFTYCLRLISACSNSHCWIPNESLLNDANGLESSIDCTKFLRKFFGRAMSSQPILRGRKKFSFLLFPIFLKIPAIMFSIPDKGFVLSIQTFHLSFFLSCYFLLVGVDKISN